MNNLQRCIGVGIVLTVLVAVAVGDDDAAAFVAFDCEVDTDCRHVDCGGDPDKDSATCGPPSENYIKGSADGRNITTSTRVCQCARRAWLFTTFGAYIACLLGVAVYSRFSAKQAVAAVTARQQPPAGADFDPSSPATFPAEAPGDGDGDEDVANSLRQHFMATGNFGTAVMADSGFVAMRWLGIGIPVNICVMWLFPRMRQIGTKRKYDSPTDIIGDRFNCNSLRLVSACTFVIPLFIYTTVQFKSVMEIMDAVSLGRIDRYSVAVLVCSVIIFCEWVGGQRSVTLSDSLQAGIMLVAFMVMPFAVASIHGGMAGIVKPGCNQAPNCIADKAPWMIMSPTTTGKCPHEAFQVIGVDDTTTMPMYPDNLVSTTCTDRLYVLPAAMGDPNCIISTYTNGTHFNTGVTDSEKMLAAKVDRNPIYDHTTVSMMGFIINAFAFPLNPHFLQKVFVAKSDKVLKHSLMILCGGALMVNLPSMYYGLVRRSLYEPRPCENVAGGFESAPTVDAFAFVAGTLVDAGGFAEFVAVIATCSVAAAIMSTCDSTIIGANNVVTVELFQNWILRGGRGSPKSIKRVSFAFTPIFAIAALMFAFFSDGVSFTTLLNLQNSFVWQVLPTIAVAMHSDKIAAHPLLYGQVAGLAATLAMELVLDVDAGKAKTDYKLPSGLWAVMINVCVVFIAQVILNAIGSSLANDTTRTSDTIRLANPAQSGPYWMKHPRLTAANIDAEIMGKTVEPLATPKGKACIAVAVAVFMLSLPWYSEPYSAQTILSGIPNWAVIFMSGYVIAIIILIYGFSLWGTEEGETDDGFVPVVPRSSVTMAQHGGDDGDGAALVANNSEA